MQGRNNNKTSHIALGALTLAFIASGCGGGGSAGGGGSSLPPQPQTAPPVQSPGHFGVALLGFDGSSGNGGMQVVSLYDGSGKVLAAPVLKTIPFPAMFDYEDTSIAPNGSYGLVADGGRTLRVLSGLSSGNPSASSYTLDVSASGAYNDLDAVRVLPNGDEAVLAANTDSSSPPAYATSLLEVSGLMSGKPQAAQVIGTPDVRNGLALSADGKVLLARGYNGVTVYSVTDTAPIKGKLGGWTYHSFTQTFNLTSLPGLYSADAHAGMAFSPADSSRAAIVGVTSGQAQIAFVTGLPGAANIQTLPINGASSAFAVAISPDGTTAFVGTDNGIAIFSGVNSTPAQVGSVVTVTDGSGNTMRPVYTLGVTADGNDVVAAGLSAAAPNNANGFLAVLAVNGQTLSLPAAGWLSGVQVLGLDQILVQ